MQKTARGGKAATLSDVARMLALLRIRGPGKQVSLGRVLGKFKNPLFHGDYRFPDFALTAAKRVPEGGGSRGLVYSTPNAGRGLSYALLKTPKAKHGFGLLTTISGDSIPVLEHMHGSPLVPARTLARRGKVYAVATRVPHNTLSALAASRDGLARFISESGVHATDASLLVNLHKLRTLRPEFRRYIDPALRRFDAKALEAERIAALDDTGFGFFKTAENATQSMYERPYTAAQMRAAGYPDALVRRLMADPVHAWRAKTGIELIHREPDLKEAIRVWVNWNRMTAAAKRRPDRKSIDLFGIDNKTHFERLRPTYEDGQEART